MQRYARGCHARLSVGTTLYNYCTLKVWYSSTEPIIGGLPCHHTSCNRIAVNRAMAGSLGAVSAARQGGWCLPLRRRRSPRSMSCIASSARCRARRRQPSSRTPGAPSQRMVLVSSHTLTLILACNYTCFLKRGRGARCSWWHRTRVRVRAFSRWRV